MPTCTRSAVSIVTDFFTSDDIEATARRTGLVQRAAKMTGKLFLALMTFGTWSEAHTTLAQLAAKVTQLGQQVDIFPEAMHQRMHKKAMAFLQAMLRQALAKVQGLEHVCDDGVFMAFTHVYLADSTDFGLPDALHKTFPGSGGSAAKAGAKIQVVWDYKNTRTVPPATAVTRCVATNRLTSRATRGMVRSASSPARRFTVASPRKMTSPC